MWHLKRLGADEFDEQWEPFHKCVGHNPQDLQPFHSMFGDWDADRTEASADRPPWMKTYYTNGDLYDLLRPDRADLPYMYDNFAWPHCSVSEGVWSGAGFRLFCCFLFPPTFFFFFLWGPFFFTLGACSLV